MEVYVIGRGAEGPHKIGFSSSPDKRLRELQCGSPERLAILHRREHPRAKQVESHAHWLLDEHTVSGEWFSGSLDEMVSAVDEAELAVDEGRGKKVARRMGRPALGIKATQVRLSEAIMAQIDAMAGPGKRAQFIREAVENELARRAKPKA